MLVRFLLLLLVVSPLRAGANVCECPGDVSQGGARSGGSTARFSAREGFRKGLLRRLSQGSEIRYRLRCAMVFT
jgi:hypothetical protein